MEYVIPAVIVVLLVAGLVTFLVVNATRKGGPVADEPAEGPGIGEDETPLGDTREHAGEQTEHGATADDPEQRPVGHDDAGEAAHVARPGEGEGRERLEFDDERPRSERLADRER
jgi:hypothetical protein